MRIRKSRMRNGTKLWIKVRKIYNMIKTIRGRRERTRKREKKIRNVVGGICGPQINENLKTTIAAPTKNETGRESRLCGDRVGFRRKRTWVRKSAACGIRLIVNLVPNGS